MNIFKTSPYWSMLLVATVVCFIISLFRAPRSGISRGRGAALTLLLILYGCIGAKMLYIIENPSAGFSLGGMSFFGSVFFVPAAVAVTALISRGSVGKYMDFVAPYVALIVAFMRIGCYFNGCCGARVITVSNMTFTPPVQLFECFFDICIFLYLMFAEYKNKIYVCGEQYPKFMIMYAVIRFVLETVRDTPKNISGLSLGQWLSVISVTAGTGILYIMRLNRKGYRS